MFSRRGAAAAANRWPRPRASQRVRASTPFTGRSRITRTRLLCRAHATAADSSDASGADGDSAEPFSAGGLCSCGAPGASSSISSASRATRSAILLLASPGSPRSTNSLSRHASLNRPVSLSRHASLSHPGAPRQSLRNAQTDQRPEHRVGVLIVGRRNIQLGRRCQRRFRLRCHVLHTLYCVGNLVPSENLPGLETSRIGLWRRLSQGIGDGKH